MLCTLLRLEKTERTDAWPLHYVLPVSRCRHSKREQRIIGEIFIEGYIPAILLKLTVFDNNDVMIFMSYSGTCQQLSLVAVSK